MKLMESLARRIVGRARRRPTEEDALLEYKHRQAVASMREATAHINGNRARTLDELKEKIDAADGMMKEALDGGKV